MKKYTFLFALAVFVMNAPIMAMHIGTKFYSHNKHHIFFILRMFNKAYYAESDNKSPVDTFKIRDLRIENFQLINEIAKLKKKAVLRDLTNEERIQESIWHDESIEICQRSIERNEDDVRTYLDELCNFPKKSMAHE